jgi:hypothetical protein
MQKLFGGRPKFLYLQTNFIFGSANFLWGALVSNSLKDPGLMARVQADKSTLPI